MLTLSTVAPDHNIFVPLTSLREFKMGSLEHVTGCVCMNILNWCSHNPTTTI